MIYSLLETYVALAMVRCNQQINILNEISS